VFGADRLERRLFAQNAQSEICAFCARREAVPGSTNQSLAKEERALVVRESFLDRNFSTILMVLFGSAITCLVVLLCFVFFKLGLPRGVDYTQWGQLGDFFGGTLNPIFGFLGFAAILTTLYIQKRELSLTLDELRQARTVATDSERISRLHAQLTAMSQILEIKRKQAEEASNTHNVVVKEKAKSGRTETGPYDEYFFNLHLYLSHEVRHYSDRIERILEELGGAPAPTATQRAELQAQLHGKLEEIRAAMENANSTDTT
jgi:hypothetical protein